MVRYAIIGAGAVADYHHVPGIRLDPRARLVAACDPNEELLQRRRAEWNIDRLTTNYEVIAGDPDIDAVIIATPNFTHAPIALACAAAGKHVMCEKPLGVSAAEAVAMYRAAEAARCAI
jgi:predicted dehydrogenase